MSFDLLLSGATVVRIAGGRATADPADLAISGPNIAAVEAPGTIDRGRAEEVWEVSGMLALPGLVNSHAHTAMTLFRGLAEDVTVDRWFNDFVWPLESNLTEEDVYWGALLGLAEMIESGVTSVADHYFFMGAVARAVEEAGTRAVLSPTVFGTEAELDEAASLVERWQGAGSGRITTWLGPHSPYLTPPAVLRTAARRAQQLGVGVHIHVSETDEQVRASRAAHGKTPVEMLADCGLLEVPILCAHAIWATESDIGLLASARAGVAHCPKTAMKLGSGAAPVVAMREAGLPVGIGSDGPASNNTLDILEAMRLAALLQKHHHGDPERLTVPEVLAMATTEGARAIGLQGVGNLAAGQRADLVLVRTDGAHMHPQHDPLANLVYAARAGDVDTVLCDGRVLLRGGRLQTLDKEAILAEVEGRLNRLRRRVPELRIQTYPGS